MHDRRRRAEPPAFVPERLEAYNKRSSAMAPLRRVGDPQDVANAFLNAKKVLLDAGELSYRSWADYKQACDEAVTTFGKARAVTDLRPDDFAALRSE